jgi:hypothetical protein
VLLHKDLLMNSLTLNIQGGGGGMNCNNYLELYILLCT